MFFFRNCLSIEQSLLGLGKGIMQELASRTVYIYIYIYIHTMYHDVICWIDYVDSQNQILIPLVPGSQLRLEGWNTFIRASTMPNRKIQR